MSGTSKITAGLAHSKAFTDQIKRNVGRYLPVKIYPGELEGEAMAEGAYRVIRGLEEVKTYVGI